MVDVTEKPATHRTAIASGVLRMQPETLARIRSGSIAKGDVLTVADVGAVMAAKRAADIIPMCHALALSGVPILNGFWSKELVLEAGLTEGPAWAYIGMLLGAGLTALYTFRMVSLTFFGAPPKAGGIFDPRGERHAHDAPNAMRISLGLLSLGTLTTWLLAGPFGQMLESTLPYHTLHALPTGEVLNEVITAPATLIALAVIAVGLWMWWKRDRWTRRVNQLQGLAGTAANGFGFESINRGIVGAVQGSAEALRITQTGQLNWNIVGIVTGLIVVLIVLAWGA